RARGGHHLLQRGPYLVGLGGADAGAAVGLRELHEIRAGSKVDLAEALLVDDALPLAHHAVATVVDDDGLHRQPLFVARRPLLTVTLERAGAVDVPTDAAGG